MPDENEDSVAERNDEEKKKKEKGTKVRASLRLPNGLTSLLAATALAASAAAIALTVTTTCEECPAGPPGPAGPQGPEGTSSIQSLYSSAYELTCGEETIINVNLEKDDVLQGFLLKRETDVVLGIEVPQDSTGLFWQDTVAGNDITFSCVADAGGVYSLTIAAQQCTTEMKSRGVTLVYWVTRQ